MAVNPAILRGRHPPPQVLAATLNTKLWRGDIEGSRFGYTVCMCSARKLMHVHND